MNYPSINWMTQLGWNRKCRYYLWKLKKRMGLRKQGSEQIVLSTCVSFVLPLFWTWDRMEAKCMMGKLFLLITVQWGGANEERRSNRELLPNVLTGLVDWITDCCSRARRQMGNSVICRAGGITEMGKWGKFKSIPRQCGSRDVFTFNRKETG